MRCRTGLSAACRSREEGMQMGNSIVNAGRWLPRLGVLALLWTAGPARAISENFTLGDDQVKMVLNNTFTAGGAIRMQSPSANLIGKGDLNRNVCGVPYQACQGVFKDQIF